MGQGSQMRVRLIGREDVAKNRKQRHRLSLSLLRQIILEEVHYERENGQLKTLASKGATKSTFPLTLQTDSHSEVLQEERNSWNTCWLKTRSSSSNCYRGYDICLFLWLAQGVNTFHIPKILFTVAHVPPSSLFDLLEDCQLIA